MSACSPLFIGVSNISASHLNSLFLQLSFLDWAFDWTAVAYAFRSSAGDRSLLKLSDSGTCVATRFPCGGTLHYASAGGSLWIRETKPLPRHARQTHAVSALSSVGMGKRVI